MVKLFQRWQYLEMLRRDIYPLLRLPVRTFYSFFLVVRLEREELSVEGGDPGRFIVLMISWLPISPSEMLNSIDDDEDCGLRSSCVLIVVWGIRDVEDDRETGSEDACGNFFSLVGTGGRALVLGFG